MNSWWWFFAGSLAGVLATLAGTALMHGTPRRTTAESAPGHPGMAAPATRAESMEAATAALQSRLDQHDGTPEEWQLLAQSYDFLGRPTEAAAARAHVRNANAGSQDWPDASDVAALSRDVSASSSVPTSPQQTPPGAAAAGAAISATAIAALKRQLDKNPADARGWLTIAAAYKQQRNDSAARQAYERVVLLRGMDSQAWADYADVLASLNHGSLNAGAARAIKNALAMDPTNAKALWLEATQAYQQKRYADSRIIWTQLRSVLPPDSEDARMVEANIAEADRLAGRTSPGAESATSAATAVVSGVVSLDSSFASLVQPGATLFVYAKSVDSPGAPLAVMRVTASRWPVSFLLDDSTAMLPTRKLSQFQRVIVEARVSRSGQVMPAAGDLYVESEVLNPFEGKKLTLVINRKIG
jgi:cytochrome c-type biogenesis protein CcmH